MDSAEAKAYVQENFDIQRYEPQRRFAPLQWLYELDVRSQDSMYWRAEPGSRDPEYWESIEYDCMSRLQRPFTSKDTSWTSRKIAVRDLAVWDLTTWHRHLMQLSDIRTEQDAYDDVLAVGHECFVPCDSDYAIPPLLKQSCDEARIGLLDAPCETLGDFYLRTAEGRQEVPVVVDMASTDDQLKAAFKQWLKDKRATMREAGREVATIKLFDTALFAKWANYQVLAYLDLVLFEAAFDIEIKYHEKGDMLFPGMAGDLANKVRQTIRPAAEKAIDQANLDTLHRYAAPASAQRVGREYR